MLKNTNKRKAVLLVNFNCTWTGGNAKSCECSHQIILFHYSITCVCVYNHLQNDTDINVVLHSRNHYEMSVHTWSVFMLYSLGANIWIIMCGSTIQTFADPSHMLQKVSDFISCTSTFYRLPLQYIQFLNVLKLNPLKSLPKIYSKTTYIYTTLISFLSYHLTCSIQAEVFDRWKNWGYCVPQRKLQNNYMQNKKVQKMSMFQNILQTFYIKLPNVFQRTQILFLYTKKITNLTQNTVYLFLSHTN